MLNSIQTKSARIQLVPEQVRKNPSLQIFSADSMSLVIGPNGSGKSLLLVEIVEKILSINTAVEGENNPYSQTLAVYYTPVPYRVEMPDECEQFIDLQEKIRSTRTPRSDFSVLQDVAKFFDFSPQLVLSFNSYSQILQDIYPFFTKSSMASSQNNFPGFTLAKENAEAAQVEAERYRREMSLDYLKYVETEVYQNVQNAESQLERVIQKQLHQYLGEYHGAKLLALLETVRVHNRKFDIIQAVLEHNGLIFQRRIKQFPKAALATYDRIFNILKQMCVAAGLRDIIEGEISISQEVAAALGKFNYSRFAKISLNNLSAGGNALVTQFTKIEQALRRRKKKSREYKNLLLLIDEGDVFLHLSWQQKYIKYLNEYISRLKQSRQFETIQVILTTHSPVLMSDFPRDCITKLDEVRAVKIRDKIRGEHRHLLTTSLISFGAPLQSIINKTGESGTIGEFSADFMKNMVRLAREGSNLDPYHVEMIDDPIVKSYLAPAIRT